MSDLFAANGEIVPRASRKFFEPIQGVQSIARRQRVRIDVAHRVVERRRAGGEQPQLLGRVLRRICPRRRTARLFSSAARNPRASSITGFGSPAMAATCRPKLRLAGPSLTACMNTSSSPYSMASRCTLAMPDNCDGEIGQLEVVRREQRERAVFRRELHRARAREREAVVGRRAAADFVHQHEAVLGGVVQDVRGFAHLDHERRLAARQIVAGADAREDAVDRSDRRATAPARSCRCARAARSARSGACRSICRPCSGR